MPQFRDFLERFRPAGAPGAARAAVPADRARELAEELGPVLELFEGTDAERARVIAQAHREAGQIISAARAQAAAIAADADQRAAAARDQAAQQALAAARMQAADLVAGASLQAGRTRELAAQRVPELAGRAVSLIRQLGTP